MNIKLQPLLSFQIYLIVYALRFIYNQSTQLFITIILYNTGWKRFYQSARIGYCNDEPW